MATERAVALFVLATEQTVGDETRWGGRPRSEGAATLRFPRKARRTPPMAVARGGTPTRHRPPAVDGYRLVWDGDEGERRVIHG